MRKMRKINVFSIVAVLVLVVILGCNFIPENKIQNELQAEVVETVDTQSNENEMLTSSAVFINPDLLKANESGSAAVDGETQTSSAVFINPELEIANN